MNNRANYSFAYYVKNREDVADKFAVEDSVMRNLTYDDAITWDAVLRDFIDFLSGIYGYDIGNSVKFETFEEKLERIWEEQDDGSDWPWDDEEEITDDEGEEAPKV